MERTKWLLAVFVTLAGCEADPVEEAGEDAGPEMPVESVDAAPPDAEVPADVVSYARDVHPVLVRSCTKCHKSDMRGDYRSAELAYAALMGPVRLLDADLACVAGTGGLVVPGQPEESALWRLITVCGEDGMPKKDDRGVLADFDPEGAELIRQWIEAGAPNN